MKKTDLVSFIPVCVPPLSDADKADLASDILTALKAGKDGSVIKSILVAKGATDGEAAGAASAMKSAYDDAIVARKANVVKTAKGVNTVWLIVGAAVAILVAVILLLRPAPASKAEVAELLASVATKADVVEATVGLATADGVTQAVAPLATGDDLDRLAGALADRFESLDTGMGRLEGKMDSIQTGMGRLEGSVAEAKAEVVAVNTVTKELSSKVDAVAASAGRTETIVTTGLTYRVRCRKDSSEPACVECFGKGEKRCYYRRPFRAASASQVAEIPHLVRGKVVEATEPPKVEQPTTPTDTKKCPDGCKSETKATQHQLVPVKKG